MRARQPLEPRILRHSQRHSILQSQLFQFCHNTISDTRRTLRIQTIHHRRHHLQSILQSKIDKVRIHQHQVRWAKLRIVTKEESTRDFRRDHFFLLLFGLLRLLFRNTATYSPRIHRREQENDGSVKEEDGRTAVREQQQSGTNLDLQRHDMASKTVPVGGIGWAAY